MRTNKSSIPYPLSPSFELDGVAPAVGFGDGSSVAPPLCGRVLDPDPLTKPERPEWFGRLVKVDPALCLDLLSGTLGLMMVDRRQRRGQSRQTTALTSAHEHLCWRVPVSSRGVAQLMEGLFKVGVHGAHLFE